MSESGTVEVSVPMDGYDITVSIGVRAIRRRIKKAEVLQTEELAHRGPKVLDLSRFATVEAEPTTEQWDKLTEKALQGDND